jgi:fructose-1,6-bisphosphatase/inositol monophosphatase family enzyme
MGIAKRVRIFGCSAVEMCFVGAGALDAYLNLNTTTALDRGEKVVDIAAASVVIEEAGGVLFDTQGERMVLTGNLKERSNVLAVANMALYEDVLSVLEG